MDIRVHDTAAPIEGATQRPSGRQRRIGILGGTFDPVHKGHVALAKAALDSGAVDEVLVIPAAIPSFKTESVNATVAQRMDMCELAFGGMESVRVSDIEARRCGVTYTVDTIRELKGARPEDKFYFLIGSDAALLLPEWKQAEALAEEVEFLIFGREGTIPDAEAVAGILGERGFRATAMPQDIERVSSTEIRNSLHGGADAKDLVPEGVSAYIEENGLYRR